MYTLDGGPDLGSDWGSNDKTVASLSVGAGILSPSFKCRCSRLHSHAARRLDERCAHPDGNEQELPGEGTCWRHVVQARRGNSRLGWFGDRGCLRRPELADYERRSECPRSALRDNREGSGRPVPPLSSPMWITRIGTAMP